MTTPTLARCLGVFDATTIVMGGIVRPQWGTTCFPRLVEGRVDDLCALLRGKYETSVVPGRFFGAPDHFRIGLGGDPEMTREALARLGEALDARA